MSLLLGISRCLFNNIDTFKFKPIEIKSKKLLIVGMGGIGQEISKLSNSFWSKSLFGKQKTKQNEKYY